MKFTATIRQEGKTATGIPVPPEVVEALGSGKKPPFTVPDDLAAALSSDASAKATFEALSFSRPLALVLPIEQAKAADTRQRRIDKVLDTLRNG